MFVYGTEITDSLINNQLIRWVCALLGEDTEKCTKALTATGQALIIMQQSYQEFALNEQERLLT